MKSRDKTGTHYKNYGRVNPNRNEFRIALCDRYGWPLIYYKAYWSPKKGIYKCYPEKVIVPGEYEFGVMTLSMRDIDPR